MRLARPGRLARSISGQELVRLRGGTLAKLLVLPAGVYAMAVHLFHLPAPATAALVTMAAYPVGVNAAALVQADGKNPGLVSSAILLSTLACVATIPFWIGIVRAL